MAATRRGWVTAMHFVHHLVSRRNCGSCVDLPEPVSPDRTSTSFSCNCFLMSCWRAQMGNFFRDSSSLIFLLCRGLFVLGGPSVRFLLTPFVCELVGLAEAFADAFDCSVAMFVVDIFGYLLPRYLAARKVSISRRSARVHTKRPPADRSCRRTEAALRYSNQASSSSPKSRRRESIFTCNPIRPH